MTYFKCGVCGYVSIDGSAPDTCPSCGSPKKVFKESKVNTPTDFKVYGEPEKKHIPFISVTKACGFFPNEGCTDVNVKIGEVVHPMTAEHYIKHIDFYIDKKFVARQQLTPDKVNPAGSLHIKVAEGKLTVVENCNIHGDWLNEADF